MGTVAAVLVALGIIVLIYSVFERAKAARVNKTPLVKTSEASAASGLVSVEGNVVCQQPLVAPFSGAACLYYSIKTTAEWKDGDTNKSKEISNDKVAARFSIDDGSGPVAVDAAKGGNFDPTQKKTETKGTGLMGGITGKELMFGQYAVSTGALSLGTKYKVEEECLPMASRLYVNGISQGGAITTPSMLRSLLISNKSRDELLSSALQSSKMAMLVGLGGLVIGGGLGVVSRMMAPSTAEAAATTTVAAPTPEVAAAPAAAVPAAPEPAADPVVPAMKVEDLKQVVPSKKGAGPTSAASSKSASAAATAKSTAAATPSAATAPTTATPKASAAKAGSTPAAPAAAPAAPTPATPKAGAAPKAAPAASK